MSPQVLSSVRLTSTTTFTAAAASTTAAVGNNNTFSPIGSPPLVLSFLSIGLFSAAMVFVFGWRRIQLGRGWRFAAVPVNNHSDVQIIHVDIPKLWDLKNGGTFTWGQVREDEKGGGPEVDMSWVNLMPLSAKRVSDSPTSGRCVEPRQPPHNSTIPNSNPLSWWDHRRPSPRHDNETKVKMQVAVTIVMPSPQYPIHIKNRNIDKYNVEKNMDKRMMTDYCIGMYECSWC